MTPAKSQAKRKPEKPSTSTVPDGEATPIVKGSHVYLVDGSGYIFRAFHALPPLTRPSDGLPVGAVHGFCAMLWKLLRESKVSEAPTHLAVIFDASEKTFRNEIYEDYKAHRPPAPEELVPQFPLIRDAVKAFNIACIEQEGFEADDIIATYARQIVDAGGDVTIVSSDKDLMQLVRPGVLMLDPMKVRKLGRDEVMEKFGVPPEKVVDVQALAGDSTDNVPGVPGIGIKTAAELINAYGDLDTLLARATEIKQPKRREKLIEFADQARLSRELVRLKDDVDMGVPVDALGVHDPDPATLLGFLRVMEFSTLTRRISEALGTEPPAAADAAAGASAAAKERKALPGPGAGEAPAAPAAAETPRRRGALCRARRQDAFRPLQVRDGHDARASRGVDHRRLCRRPRRLRHRNDRHRPHARRAGRLLAGGRAGQGLLRAARPPPRRHRARSRRSGARSRFPCATPSISSSRCSRSRRS